MILIKLLDLNHNSKMYDRINLLIVGNVLDVKLSHSTGNQEYCSKHRKHRKFDPLKLKDDKNSDYINDDHFKGRAIDIKQIIHSRFLTAEDIAKDLKISVRKAKGLLSPDPKKSHNYGKSHYYSKYHIKNVSYVHQVQDNKGHYILSNRGTNGTSSIKLYKKGDFNGKPQCFGMRRPQAVVSYSAYADFINTIDNYPTSHYEQKMVSKYKHMSKKVLLRKLAYSLWRIRILQMDAYRYSKQLDANNLNVIKNINSLFKLIYSDKNVSNKLMKLNDGGEALNKALVRPKPTNTRSKLVNKINKNYNKNLKRE